MGVLTVVLEIPMTDVAAAEDLVRNAEDYDDLVASTETAASMEFAVLGY